MKCFGVKEDLFPGFYDGVKGAAVSALITGVGIHATAFHLGRILAMHHFDLAVNIGLAGSFSKELFPGEVVEVVTDEFGDLGAEDHDDFLNIFQLGMADSFDPVFQGGLLKPIAGGLNSLGIRKVRGTTVNTVHGAARSIQAFSSRSSAEIETMEGAAFFYCCNFMKIPSMQIRAISNYVEPRNREAWQVKEAIMALTDFLSSRWDQITTLS